LHILYSHPFAKDFIIKKSPLCRGTTVLCALFLILFEPPHLGYVAPFELQSQDGIWLKLEKVLSQGHVRTTHTAGHF